MARKDFHRQRISQSNYRGGTGKLKKSGVHEELSGELETVSISDNETKKELRKKIIQESDSFLESLLAEDYCVKIMKSSYFDEMLKKIGVE